MGRGVNHSPPPSAQVKNEWSYTSTHPVCLQSMDSGNITFTLLSLLYWLENNYMVPLLLNSNSRYRPRREYRQTAVQLHPFFALALEEGELSAARPPDSLISTESARGTQKDVGAPEAGRAV